MEEKEIGKVTHYYGKVSVAVVELAAPLQVGDRVAFRGATTDFEQEIKSIQIEHQNVQRAEAEQLIGVKVDDKVRAGDVVYKLE